MTKQELKQNKQELKQKWVELGQQRAAKLADIEQQHIIPVDAWYDQELACVCVASGMRQSDVAEVFGKAQSWVSYMVRFGGFLEFITACDKPKIKDLTEGKFRSLWEQTEGSGKKDERRRYRAVLDMLESGSATPAVPAAPPAEDPPVVAKQADPATGSDQSATATASSRPPKPAPAASKPKPEARPAEEPAQQEEEEPTALESTEEDRPVQADEKPVILSIGSPMGIREAIMTLTDGQWRTAKQIKARVDALTGTDHPIATISGTLSKLRQRPDDKYHLATRKVEGSKEKKYRLVPVAQAIDPAVMCEFCEQVNAVIAELEDLGKCVMHLLPPSEVRAAAFKLKRAMKLIAPEAKSKHTAPH